MNFRGPNNWKITWVPYLPFRNEEKDSYDRDLINGNDRTVANHADFCGEVDELVGELEANVGNMLAREHIIQIF